MAFDDDILEPFAYNKGNYNKLPLNFAVKLKRQLISGRKLVTLLRKKFKYWNAFIQ